MIKAVADPYESGLIKARPSSIRLEVLLRAVGVLDSRRTGRGMRLIFPRTRCIRRYDIHEIIVTDTMSAPGEVVDTAHYVGFFEFLEGCVIGEGDRFMIGDSLVGELLGFDETHAPNHINIILHTQRLQTGKDHGLEPGDTAKFVPWNI